jgi:hypothetical protein
LIVTGVVYGMVALWVQVRQYTLAHQPASQDKVAVGEAAAALASAAEGGWRLWESRRVPFWT